MGAHSSRFCLSGSFDFPPTRESRSCEIVLVQRLTEHGLDHCLAADVQLIRLLVKFFQHGRGEVHIHPLNGGHHSPLVGEESRNVLAPFGHAGDGFGRKRLLLTTSALHTVPVPGWLTSRESRGGRTHRPRHHAPQTWRCTACPPPTRWRHIDRAGPSVDRDNTDAKRSPALLRNQCPGTGSTADAGSCVCRSGTAWRYNCYTTLLAGGPGN